MITFASKIILDAIVDASGKVVDVMTSCCVFAFQDDASTFATNPKRSVMTAFLRVMPSYAITDRFSAFWLRSSVVSVIYGMAYTVRYKVYKLYFHLGLIWPWENAQSQTLLGLVVSRSNGREGETKWPMWRKSKCELGANSFALLFAAAVDLMLSDLISWDESYSTRRYAIVRQSESQTTRTFDFHKFQFGFLPGCCWHELCWIICEYSGWWKLLFRSLS